MDRSPAVHRRRSPAAGLVALIAWLPDWTLTAQLAPVGPELQVNVVTVDFQSQPDVAVDEDGRFVVVWTNSFEPALLGDCCQTIQARRFDADATPLGGQFQVSSVTTSYLLDPAVAFGADGTFLVVWSANGSAGSDDSAQSLQAQRFDASGAPLGAQFQVNSFTPLNQLSPAITGDASGGFVIAWSSAASAGSDSSLSSIQARRFDSAGQPIGDDFQVNSYTTGAQYLPVVARAGGGGFVVVWVSDGSPGEDDDSWSIQARRFDANGSPLGAQTQVNSFSGGTQFRPAIASDAAGNFVVAWDSTGSSGDDSSSESVLAARFDGAGAPLGGEFQVNDFTPGAQLSPHVATSDDGRFSIVWSSGGSSGSDGDSDSIQGRRFDSDGLPLGRQVQVNTFTTSAQRFPRVADHAGETSLVVWESLGSSGDDDDVTSVLAQRLAAAFFYGGFESGDFAGWSSTSP